WRKTQNSHEETTGSHLPPLRRDHSLRQLCSCGGRLAPVGHREHQHRHRTDQRTHAHPVNMATAYANSPSVAPYDLSLRRFLLYSLVLHVALSSAMVVSVFLEYRGTAWGGVGGDSEGSVKVNLVGSAGLPMPQPPVISESRTFDPTNGLFKEL